MVNLVYGGIRTSGQGKEFLEQWAESVAESKDGVAGTSTSSDLSE